MPTTMANGDQSASTSEDIASLACFIKVFIEVNALLYRQHFRSKYKIKLIK